MKRLFPAFLAICLFFSCAEPVVERERKAISRGVYATKDSIDASRYDLAKVYINETTRLVAPPKDRIKIPEFATPGKKATKTEAATERVRYVVLPPDEQVKNIIVKDSSEYKQLVSENSSLRESEKQAWNEYGGYVKYVDQVSRDRDTELAKLRAKPGFFGTIWNFVKGLFKWGPIGFIVLLVVGLGLSIAFPPLLGIIFSVLHVIGTVLATLAGWAARFIIYFFDLLGKLFKKKK